MSTILINCSNLKKGGGLQVADSICCDLSRFLQHHFIVVLSSYLKNAENKIKKYDNCDVTFYDSSNGLKTLLTGRDKFLDELVSKNKVDAVFSVFGPISWTPHCLHLCGFARSHIVLSDSPYFSAMPFGKRLKEKAVNIILTYFFCRGVNAFFTESAYISEKWQLKVGKRKVYTVTNYYHQVFDLPAQWIKHPLPGFEGSTMLCITGYYPHKNLEIAIEVTKTLKAEHPSFRFRFAFTIDECQYPALDEDMRQHFCFIGRTDVYEAPSLYQQATIMFQPSLLECFSATYPEAMRMNVPIVAADMGFARSLCGEAAVYYPPLDAKAAADAIYKVSMDKELLAKLINNGKKQLSCYDTYKERTDKLIKIVEQLIETEKDRNK